MNLFCSVLAIVCFAQICLSAPITSGDVSSASDENATDHKFDAFHSRLKAMPNLESKSVDDFIETIKKFDKVGQTDKEEAEGVLWWMGLALQGPTCDKTKIDLSPLLSWASNGRRWKGITEAEMRVIQEQLSKIVSAEKVQHAMIILHGFRIGATKKEEEAASLDLIRSAVQSLRTECKKIETMKQ